MPTKSREQQAALSIHRARSLLIKQRTQLVNMMRSVLAELGIAIPVGIVKALQMAREIVDGESRLDLPPRRRTSSPCWQSSCSSFTPSCASSTYVSPLYSGAMTGPGAWRRSLISGRSARPHSPRR